MSTNKVFQIIYAILNTSLWLDIHNETQNLTMYLSTYCWIYFYSICCNVRLLHFTIKNYISIWYKWHILQDYLDNITKMQISKSSLFYAGSMYWRYGIAGLLLRFSFEILQWVIYVCKCIYIYIYIYMHWQYKLSFYYICPWCHTTSEEIVYSFAMRYSFAKDSKCKTHEYLFTIYSTDVLCVDFIIKNTEAKGFDPN